MARSTYLEKEVIQEHISSTGSYDGTSSGLASDNVIDAIDEVKSLIKSSANEISFVAVDGNLTETDTNVQQAVGTLDGAVRTLQTQVIGGVTYKGGYNATTNTPDLESPDTITIEIGDMYTVTADGDFYTEAVTVGDVLIAEVDAPSGLTGWTVVENNLEDAADVAFNNVASGLTSTNVQGAIDEVESRVDSLEADTTNNYVKINSTGNAATATANDAIAIGENATTVSAEGLTIGLSAYNAGISSTVIGAFSFTDGTGTDADNVVILGAATDISSGNVNSSIGIGNNITIGNSTQAVAIGRQSSVTNANRGIAIGFDAGVTAASAVQIGIGDNNVASTIQYLGNRIANAEGLYTSHNAVNYSPADADNVTSHFQAIDIALGNTYTPPQPLTVNEETINANKSLDTRDSVYQHILSNTASLEVSLPASPVNGTHFIIKNDDAGSESITITGGPVAAVLAPGKMYEVVYGSTKWMVI